MRKDEALQLCWWFSWWWCFQVLDRGEKIELLVDKTENLQFQADSFQRQGRQLRRKMWIQSLQMKLMVGGAVLSFILIVWVVACGGFKCSSWCFALVCFCLIVTTLFSHVKRMLMFVHVGTYNNISWSSLPQAYL